MTDRAHYHPNLIFAVGTQVVTLRDVVGPNGRTLHPRGSVGVVVAAPRDTQHSYRVRFPDGVEEPFQPSELTLLAKFKEGEIGDSDYHRWWQQPVRASDLPLRHRFAGVRAGR